MDFFQPTINRFDTDTLIIGGGGAGGAGCAAAIEARENNPQAKIIIIEKTQSERYDFLASGSSAINAYITENQTPENPVIFNLV